MKDATSFYLIISTIFVHKPRIGFTDEKRIYVAISFNQNVTLSLPIELNVDKITNEEEFRRKF